MLKFVLVGLFVASMGTLTVAASYLPIEQAPRSVASVSTQIG